MVTATRISAMISMHPTASLLKLKLLTINNPHWTRRRDLSGRYGPSKLSKSFLTAIIYLTTGIGMQMVSLRFFHVFLTISEIMNSKNSITGEQRRIAWEFQCHRPFPKSHGLLTMARLPFIPQHVLFWRSFTLFGSYWGETGQTA
jgi:hypothetical protein